MPCNSDYLRPTNREEELRRAAKLLVWVKTKLHKAVPDYAKKAAADIYGNGGDRAIKELCATLKQMNKNKREELIYGNAHDPIARDLADWWETHQAADAEREQREAEQHDHMRDEKIARIGMPAKSKKALGLKTKNAGDRIKRLVHEE